MNHARYCLRPGQESDYAAFVRFFGELQIEDPIPSQAAWNSDRRSSWFLEESDSGALVAYVHIRFLPQDAHVMHVATAPELRGRGVGTQLMHEVAKLVTERGIRSWRLNVKADNAAALKLYERFGFRLHHHSQVFRLEWDDRARLPSPTVPTRIEPIVPSQDEALELKFDLARGTLSALRVTPGSVLIQLVSTDSTALGLARFVPTYPGAMPFRVTRPEYARPLIEKMATHPERLNVPLQIVVDADPQLSAVLKEVGAKLKLEVLHLRGAVPSA